MYVCVCVCEKVIQLKEVWFVRLGPLLLLGVFGAVDQRMTRKNPNVERKSFQSRYTDETQGCVFLFCFVQNVFWNHM